MGDHPLDFEARRRLYEFIEANPGLHAREIQRQLRIPMTTLTYHLRALERGGLVVVKQEKYYHRFYPARGVPPEEKPIVSALRHRRLRDLILFLLTSGGAAYREIAEAFRLPSSTLHLYLKELVDRGVVSRGPGGRGGTYVVRDPETVVRLLQTYRRSFLDRAVDGALEVWLEQVYRPPPGRGPAAAEGEPRLLEG